MFSQAFKQRAHPGLFIFFLLLLSFLLFNACTSKEREISQRTTVSVNGSKLTAKEFGERLAFKLRAFDALYTKQPENLKRAKEEVISDFITDTLIVQWASKNNIVVPKEDLDSEVSKLRANYPDDLSFRKALAAEQLSFEKWREKVGYNLLEKFVFEKVTQPVRATITDKDIEAYYKKNKDSFRKPSRIRLKQIVLEKEVDAERILGELKKGASFEKLAQEYSVAPEGAQGGDTGWIERGTLPVFDKAFSLGVGQRSSIIKSPYGYHIFVITAKKPAEQLNLREAKDSIARLLSQEKSQQHFESWLEEQMRLSKILRDDNLIDSIRIHTEIK